MELNETLPDRVVELFEEEAPGSVKVRTGPLDSQSLQLYEIEDEFGPIEFTRPLGKKCIEQTGYAITGMRDHDSYIEIWFDPIDEQDLSEHLTVAQRAPSASTTRRMALASRPTSQTSRRNSTLTCSPSLTSRPPRTTHSEATTLSDSAPKVWRFGACPVVESVGPSTRRTTASGSSHENDSDHHAGVALVT